MILCHYSVDSYKSGEKLFNDFKQQYRFAEPFILALQRNADCFWGTFFVAMAYSRELCALGLRKYENYTKDSVEGVFEYIRQKEFKDKSVSRIYCVYYCDQKEEAVAYLKNDCIDNGNFTLEQVKLLEVEVADESFYRYDQYFFNQAEMVMETVRGLNKVFDLARSYFSMDRSDNPIIEILSAGENKILRELPLELE